jgi:hypothetical protein
MAKALIIAGIVLVIAGLAWPWLKQLPIGRLPGDFTVTIGSARVYIPLGTSILLSVILTLLIRLFR